MFFVVMLQTLVVTLYSHFNPLFCAFFCVQFFNFPFCVSRDSWVDTQNTNGWAWMWASKYFVHCTRQIKRWPSACEKAESSEMMRYGDSVGRQATKAFRNSIFHIVLLSIRLSSIVLNVLHAVFNLLRHRKEEHVVRLFFFFWYSTVRFHTRERQMPDASQTTE